jgi:hypothetical protein
MAQLDQLKTHLTRGKVYRRNDLLKWTTAVDRHLEQLVGEGTLQKLAHGLYYYPKVSVFGKVPPEEKQLVKRFLNDDRFLLTTPNAYNSLGVGTTQLYNERVVYNHKRHGEYEIGNQQFHFRIKPHFPLKASEEFLLVDLVNNLDRLEEDQTMIWQNVSRKVRCMNSKKINHAFTKYGTERAKKLFKSIAPLQ